MAESYFNVIMRDNGGVTIDASLNHVNDVPALLRAIDAAAGVLPSADPEFEAFVTTLQSNGLHRVNAVNRLRDIVSTDLQKVIQYVDGLRSGKFVMPTNRAELAQFIKLL